MSFELYGAVVMDPSKAEALSNPAEVGQMLADKGYQVDPAAVNCAIVFGDRDNTSYVTAIYADKKVPATQQVQNVDDLEVADRNLCDAVNGAAEVGGLAIVVSNHRMIAGLRTIKSGTGYSCEQLPQN
ncbi:hypothetical protein ACFL0V_02900 [Nanoarchaeota archaeon]